MSRITPELQQVLCERARQHYTDDLPYHNWAHAQEVMTIAGRIATLSTVPVIVENRPLLVITGAWHDADFHVEDLGQFATKEEVSADLAARSLPELLPHERDLLVSGIIDTTVSKHPKDGLFGEAIHEADIGYFYTPDFDHFINRVSLLREEWGSPSWETTVQRTVAFGEGIYRNAQVSLFQLLPESEAQQWIANLTRNLEKIQEK